jgi:hypothetical protein
MIKNMTAGDEKENIVGSLVQTNAVIEARRVLKKELHRQQEELRTTREDSGKRNKDLKSLLGELEQGKLEWRVYICSIWREDKDITQAGKGDLADIIRQARDKFYEANKGNHTTMSYRVSLVGENIHCPVPSSVYQAYVDSLETPSAAQKGLFRE